MAYICFDLCTVQLYCRKNPALITYLNKLLADEAGPAVLLIKYCEFNQEEKISLREIKYITLF